MAIDNLDPILKRADQGVREFLENSRQVGRIDQQSYHDALANTAPNLKKWLEDEKIDRISSKLKKGIVDTIKQEKWEQLVNAFRQGLRFGTGGIRGLMGVNKASIVKLKEEGVDTDILKGPNTMNEVVMLLASAGVAQFGKSQPEPLQKVVVGYDTRVRGQDFAGLVAQLFLAYDYTVYFFDAPCAYPELTFAIPHELVKADVGVLISASHNDYRYNGYKLSCSNGSQFDPEDRDKMYNQYIKNASTGDIKLCSFKEAKKGKLWFLGGDQPVSDFNYAGKEDCIIDMHEKHRDHIKSFLLTEDLPGRQKSAPDPLHIAYCAFHGAGYLAVPRLLREVGFVDVKPINGNKSKMNLNQPDGLFPAFCSEPGREQQPDPGDPRAAETAVAAFKEDYPGEFDKMDILIGTDPDADRCGLVVKVPENQRHIYDDKDYYLLPADDMWTLVIWYRLHREIEKSGQVKDAEEKFLTLSHTTSDSITSVARKYGIGVLKGWVGFAALAAGTRDVWEGKAKDFVGLVEGRNQTYKEVCHPFVCTSLGLDNGKRSINIATLEQSNGFSLLGGPPKDARSLGEGGHVRDKDGTFAALLLAEIAAWAKERGLTLIEVLDKHIYLDPEIGLFATFYEPDPLDGEYPGIEGDRLKKNILRRALGYYQLAMAGDLEIAGLQVKSAAIYRTGKYDRIYPPTHEYQFPDEGVRLFFDDEKLQHLTIRPSGTTNSLRFHIQLHAYPTEQDLLATKAEIRAKGRQIMDRLREMLRAPRQ
jgi:phosphoglucomutase